ncbi:hypothetical protein ACFYYH_01385 [Streptomyces sp. NPDC002018]|uniref:hypothetical protein n=1 Tax=Streptomyces sp. NPDC002018 TaxID=3364629 RepID=UPI003681F85B
MPWPRLLYGAAGVLMASAAAAGTARSWLPVAAATGGAQWVLHTALSVPAPAGHGHVRVLQGAHPLRGQGCAPHHSAPVMMAAHCVAALAVALLMYRADQALSRLPGAVGRWARVAVGLIAAAVLGSRRPAARPDVRSAPRRPYAAAVRSVVEVVLCDVVVRRGPPARRAGDVSLIPVG